MYRKELSYYFSTPIAYIVIGLYLLSISLFLWVIPGEWNIISSGYAQTDGLFQLSPWLFMLLCPALTMRLFAEEKQSGTWDILLSQPVSLWHIVLGKYFASWTLLLIGLLPCLTHYFIVWYIAEPIGNIDFGAFIGAFIGLILLSGSFLAIGLLIGSMTKSQIVAFIVSGVCCFILYWLCLQRYYISLSRGVIDMIDIVFFLSVIIIAVLTTYYLLSYLYKTR